MGGIRHQSGSAPIESLRRPLQHALAVEARHAQQAEHELLHELRVCRTQPLRHAHELAEARPAVLVAQAALPSLVAHTQSAHARGSVVHVPMKPQSATRRRARRPRMIAAGTAPPNFRGNHNLHISISKPVQLRIAIACICNIFGKRKGK